MASDTGKLNSVGGTEHLNGASSSLFDRIRRNSSGMRFGLMEFSGGLGDLGTFIPLAVGMSAVAGMDLGMILIFAGLFNIVTGLLFGLPIPVQPMKAIAAVAIAGNLLLPEIAAAGLIAGAIVLLLGWTGLVEKVERFTPRAIVRGIQLGIGVKLCFKGFQLAGNEAIGGLDGIAVAVGLGVLILLLKRVPKFPGALVLLTSGLIVLLIKSPEITSNLFWSFPHFKFVLPSLTEWGNGLVFGAIPQLPLTLLNSVLAVCALSGDLFPGRKVSTSRMAISVGFMNLVGCGLGGMPMCHGSGGLAGQYHFGARTGGSVVMLGVVKLLVGLFLGTAAMQLLALFPAAILGIMLVIAGVELALPSRDQFKSKALYVTILTALGIVVFNTLVGFMIGVVLVATSRLFSRS